MGNIDVSESQSIVKPDVKPTITENESQGASDSDRLNQSEVDPSYQDFLAGVMMDEPSVTKKRQVEVGLSRNCHTLVN